jgi:hypothetical protein
MHVINASRKGGSHGHASASHCIGGIGSPVFHRPGRYRFQTSPLDQNPQRERADPAQLSLGIVFRFCARVHRDRRVMQRISKTKGKGVGMTSKSGRSEISELDLRTNRPRAENAAANLEPKNDEIRRRAYEIYLEGGSLPGRELDDWLRAERELRKVALFTQDWNRLERHRRNSGDGN